VDVTSSSLNRIAIYQALGVPELWRFDGTRLEIYLLQDGQYICQEQSRALPGITAEMIVPFLQCRSSLGESRLVKQFRQQLRRR
jgi:Uma2 family endonuclease